MLLGAILLLSCYCDAADVLFLSTLTGAELTIAGSMSLTADVRSPGAWSQMSTSDFESYKAIIVGDPDSTNVDLLNPLVSSRQKWSPAIKGNIIILGSGSMLHLEHSRANE